MTDDPKASDDASSRNRQPRVRIGSLEMRGGKISGLVYFVGYFGATRIVVKADPEWTANPHEPEVEAGYEIFIEQLPDRSPYSERIARAGRRPLKKEGPDASTGEARSEASVGAASSG